ncbi:hypothetical protein AVBRAN12654_01030 [Campylobacter sp. RM12654]|uniref:hypothetical protein n=1 Tax=unclassified Campylobacter TaxID=2593542 RepID=UPI001DB83DFC|nr:hypothetical protein [Campylobacter sp. RM12654]MBZ7983196.1 hypothetical protein [Campylobacter sp. RM12647]MBZ7992549.1 hypothetical protein [Campylobacter sp. RM9333]
MNNLEKINNLDNLKCGEFSRALHKIAVDNTSDINEILKYAQNDPLEVVTKRARDNIPFYRLILIIVVIVDIWYYIFY